MRKRIAMPILAGALLALAPIGSLQRGITVTALRGYLDKMGLKYVPHPKSSNALVVTRSDNEHADRVDLYLEIRDDHTLVLMAYGKQQNGYFNMSRATDREKTLQRLLEANHRAFATFFVDNQGDVGARFTFTTENGVGFESFRVAAVELLRICDEYTPILEEHMRKS
jgi:hypothetical protein